MNDLPDEIRTLIGRCQIGESHFSNDDMSAALKFGEQLWRGLDELAERYEEIATSLRSLLDQIHNPTKENAA